MDLVALHYTCMINGVTQVVMTKADKVNAATREANIAQVQAALKKHPAAYPEIVLTSSEKGEGIESLRAIIAGLE